ncbi:hypothetical protein PIROE2DRAFT_13088 [Piromyces sp. E2]|nr:hypothetical protein PIROE2DRAFT_13088 [Piromyces sp. E2]|eukprot:OUM61015.1 hypothetical protein PIROE2DRAFT_13088 [Piromyces sp. E2]
MGLVEKNVIIIGIGRIGGYLLNCISSSVGAVVTHSLKFGNNAYSIQLEKAREKVSIPEPEYKGEFIPAFVDLKDAIEKIKDVGKIVIFDVSSSQNFRNILNSLFNLVKYNYKDINFEVYSCTPDQEGETKKIIDNFKLISNIKIIRDDLKSNKIQNTIEQNYLKAKKVNGKCIVTDIHRAEKEPWAAVVKSTVDNLCGKNLSSDSYKIALNLYEQYENDVESRKASPIQVDEYLWISSVRSIKSENLTHETAFIIECFEKNGEYLKACTVDENDLECDSVIIAEEKCGKSVAKRLIELSKK